MKKIIPLLVLFPAILLAGCRGRQSQIERPDPWGEIISYEQAVRHCEEYYTGSGTKDVTFHVQQNVKKATGNYAAKYDTGYTEFSKNDSLKIINLDEYVLGATFRSSGHKLIIEQRLTAKEYVTEIEGKTVSSTSKVTGSVYLFSVVDTNGYLYQRYESISVDIDSADSIIVESYLTR